MKKVTYAFEVPDFCPERCEAFSPIRAIRNDKMHCLHDDQCVELHRVLAGAGKDDGRQIAAPTGERSGADGDH